MKIKMSCSFVLAMGFTVVCHGQSDHSTLTVTTNGAARVMIVDSSGKRTGTLGGVTFQEIAESAYFVDSLDNDVTGKPAEDVYHLVQLNRPASGTFTVILTGIASGQYQLFVKARSSVGAPQAPVALTGSIVTGQTVMFSLPYSKNPAQVAVPTVVGLTQAAATTAITGAGLIVGTVTNQASSTEAAGNVISSSPVAGTQVATGSAVNLVISTGPAGSPALAALITNKTGSANARVWTVTIFNSGTDPASNVVINSFTLTQTAGAACTPMVSTLLPAAVVPAIAAGVTANGTVTIDFSSCAALARFTANATYSSHAGAFTGNMTLFNQLR